MFPIESVKITTLKEDDIEDTKLAENTNKEPRGRKAFRTLTEGYSSKEEALRFYTQAYLASVAFADEMVGKVLKSIEESEFNDNTLVLLFSDHGYSLGEKEYLFKYALWEESTRVPLIIKHPNYKNKAGQIVTHPVSLVDIYPTIKDLCNLKGSTLISEKGAELDGFSLKVFLENSETKNWSGPDEAMSIISSWKTKKPENQHISLRSKDFRFIRYANGAIELYDHRVDKNEWYNLATDTAYKAVKDNFSQKLKTFFN